MGQLNINVGTPNDENGDLVRNAFVKTEANFTELYSWGDHSLAGYSIVDEWVSYTGTRLNGDLIVTIGDYDGSYNGTKIVIDDANNSIAIDGGISSHLSLRGGYGVSFQDAITSHSGQLGVIDNTLTSTIGGVVRWALPNKTGILALTSDLTSLDWSEFMTSTGTRLGNDLVTTIGDYDDSGGWSKIIIDDVNGTVKIQGGDTVGVTFDNNNATFDVDAIFYFPVFLNNYLTFFNQAATFSTQISQPTLTANRILQLPNASGTLALTSDIATVDWSEFMTSTGTRLGNDLVTTIGDYDNLGNGTQIQLDLFNDKVSFINSGQTTFSIIPELATVYGDILVKNNFLLRNGLDTFNTTLSGQNATAARTVTLPDASGTFALEADASGFNGNLAPGDTTLQAIAQKFDDFVGGSGSLNNIIEDLTPQLGGNLDNRGYAYTGKTSVDIGIDDDNNTTGTATFNIKADGLTTTLFTVNENGVVTAPQMSISEITSTGDTALITKQYADAIYLGGSVSDIIYGAGWDGDTTVAPSKNAVYDKIALIESDIVDLQNPLLALSSTIGSPRNALLTDADGMNEVTTSSTITIDSSVTFEVGTVLTYRDSGGRVTIAYGGTYTGDAIQTYRDGQVAALWYKSNDPIDVWEAINPPQALDSRTSGEPTGSTQVFNAVEISQANYDGGTPVAGTIYIITS